MRSYRPAPASPWRLFITIYFLAVLIGFLWAAIDTGMFSNPPSKPVQPAPQNPLPTKKISTQDMLKHLQTIKTHLDAGELLAARDAAARVRAEDIPSEPLRQEFLEQKAAISMSCDLLKETRMGTLVARPALVSIVPAAGEPMNVKIVQEDASSVNYETLDGKHGRIASRDIRSRRPLRNAEVDALLDKEVQQRIQTAMTPPDIRKLFDAAEFAARNGMNQKLMGLFQKILQWDPGFVNTIRNEKAHRLFTAFLYFSQINNRDEAQATLHLLESQYPDSPWLAKVTREDRQQPAPVQKKATEPPPKIVKQPQPDPSPTEKPPPEKKLTPADELTAKANTLFEEGMTHLRNSDPLANPDSAEKENATALGKFDEAVKIYLQIQDMEDSDWLEERIRMANSHRVMCRRRMVQ